MYHKLIVRQKEEMLLTIKEREAKDGEGERNWNDVIERSRMNMGVKIYA